MVPEVLTRSEIERLDECLIRNPLVRSRAGMRHALRHPDVRIQIAPVDCLVPKGGVLVMRPLIVHASSKSRSEMRRRVLHIEYAASAKFSDGLELAMS
jgi:hypothetical protein